MTTTTRRESLADAVREHDDAARALAVWSAALSQYGDDDDTRRMMRKAVDSAVREWIAADERLTEAIERDEGPGTGQA